MWVVPRHANLLLQCTYEKYSKLSRLPLLYNTCRAQKSVLYRQRCIAKAMPVKEPNFAFSKTLGKPSAVNCTYQIFDFCMKARFKCIMNLFHFNIDPVSPLYMSPQYMLRHRNRMSCSITFFF